MKLSEDAGLQSATISLDERPAEPAVVGAAAVAAAEALNDARVIVVASGELRAEAIFKTLRSLVPETAVVLFPPSDALPGDTTQATLANICARVSALRSVRQASEIGLRIALVTSSEAAARVYAPAYDVDALELRVDDALDHHQLDTRLRDLGCEVNDRVDEAGQVAVHEKMVDLYPADRDGPVRVEFANNRIASIRDFDPLTQLSSDEAGAVTVASVTDAEAGSARVTLFDHLPDATRRSSSAPTSSDGARGSRRWSPTRAFAKFARAQFDTGAGVIVAGSARDLRFLRTHAGRSIAIDGTQRHGWADARSVSVGTVAMLEMPIDRGWQGDGVTVVAAADLLGSRAALANAGAASTGDPLREATAELRVGDVVVHEDHGIGVIAGLESVTSTVAGTETEVVVLEYAGDNRRLVPVAEADKIWRYGGERDAVTLDKLDGSSWAKRRAEVNATIEASAKELARLTAEHKRRTAPVIAPHAADYERFAARFPFDETPDQARSIASVRADLASGRPMDWLIVGDVGYGKTEVALRAVALVALAGKQAVVTAPTTVLVRQHLETFRKRFAGTGIEVAGLSRLSTPAETKAAKEGLADGSVKVVVGTGAVAAKGVVYHDLALLVIDEEQRFGAADKTKLRALVAGSGGGRPVRGMC